MHERYYLGYAALRILQAIMLAVLSTWPLGTLYSFHVGSTTFATPTLVMARSFNLTAILLVQCIIDAAFFSLPNWLHDLNPRWAQWGAYALTTPLSLIVVAYYAGIQTLSSILVLWVLGWLLTLGNGIVEEFEKQNLTTLTKLCYLATSLGGLMGWAIILAAAAVSKPPAWVYVLVGTQFVCYAATNIAQFRSITKVDDYLQTTRLYMTANIISIQLLWAINICGPLRNA